VRRLISLLCALVLLAVAGGLAGCVAVKPWEREILSHPHMQLAPRLGAAYRPHLLSIREGSIGGDQGGGGGCGCN